jgi:hypothetical protein
LEINSNFLRFLAPFGSETNTFNYSTINSNITNKNIIDAEYIATKSDQSVAYIADSNIIINNSNLIKTGVSSDLDNSEFYGVNSAILVNGGNAKIDLTNITTSSEGSNGITCTNNGSTQLFRTLINSSSNFSRGLLSTFGGSIIGTNVTISTISRSSACLQMI